jgi:cathepsin B
MLYLFVVSIFAESIVEIINNDPTSSWVAIDYPKNVMNRAKFVASLGFIPGVKTPGDYVPSNDVPAEFDARIHWAGKMHPVKDQGSCGSCWAFSVAEAMSDAQAVAGCDRGMMSVQDLVSCDKGNNACNGGMMADAQAYIVKNGITNEACLPYTSGGGRVPACPTKCQNGSDITRWKLASWRNVKASEIQEVILRYGPLSCGFMVYSDFMSYRSGVYQHKTGYLQGGHAVLMIGWGVQDGLPYWLCQNSWGPSWGEKGHFKILRGSNHCDIEGYVTLGVPLC